MDLKRLGQDMRDSSFALPADGGLWFENKDGASYPYNILTKAADVVDRHAALIGRLEKLRDDSAEIWAMSQLLPGEGIEDGIDRIASHIQQIIDEHKGGATMKEFNKIKPSILSFFTEIYNLGYKAGHHDTAEGCYTDILDCDIATYHEDVVRQIVDEHISG